MIPWTIACLFVLGPLRPAADDVVPAGYRLLVERAYLVPDFDQEVFEELWRTWPEPLRSRAATASADERRRMAFERYGLTGRPDDPSRPLQYVVAADGGWSMNCFACHGGQVAGRVIPGLPNAHFALETLTEEVRATKRRLGRPLDRMDLGQLVMPYGTTRGTTNAVMFGVALFHGRSADLSPRMRLRPPEMDHHDMDAPPWWHYAKRRRLYVDGFAPKGPRPLMQFLAIPENGPEEFARWESDFEVIAAYLESLRPPRYPGSVEREAAERGRLVFEDTCSTCHGTYGERPRYPNRIVPLERVGTDPVRLHALSPERRRTYGESWFARFGADPVIVDPGGYVAPPLDGLWASAPYFHNGSVPTVYHVLHPEERPTIWRRRSSDGYDHARLGLDVEVLDELPAALDAAERREFFDARVRGKSALGHPFAAVLTAAERRDLLEYLKTL